MTWACSTQVTGYIAPLCSAYDRLICAWVCEMTHRTFYYQNCLFQKSLSYSLDSQKKGYSAYVCFLTWSGVIYALTYGTRWGTSSITYPSQLSSCSSHHSPYVVVFRSSNFLFPGASQHGGNTRYLLSRITIIGFSPRRPAEQLSSFGRCRDQGSFFVALHAIKHNNIGLRFTGTTAINIVYNCSTCRSKTLRL